MAIGKRDISGFAEIEMHRLRIMARDGLEDLGATDVVVDHFHNPHRPFRSIDFRLRATYPLLDGSLDTVQTVRTMEEGALMLSRDPREMIRHYFEEMIVQTREYITGKREESAPAKRVFRDGDNRKAHYEKKAKQAELRERIVKGAAGRRAGKTSLYAAMSDFAIKSYKVPTWFDEYSYRKPTFDEAPF